MNIDEKILLNQIAQDVIDIEEGERWFLLLGETQRRAVLRELNFMIANAGPRNEDVPDAIAKSGLKKTFTPCVLLKTGEIRIQLAKIANLPEDELLKAFRLLIALLSVCDGRRRREKPVDTEFPNLCPLPLRLYMLLFLCFGSTSGSKGSKKI